MAHLKKQKHAQGRKRAIGKRYLMYAIILG